MTVTGGYERPHLRFPYSRGAYVEQDTDQHQTSRALAVVACPVGFRVERPEFGWRFPTYQTAPLDTASLTNALRQFAGIEAPSADEYADEASAATRRMTVYMHSTGDDPRG